MKHFTCGRFLAVSSLCTLLLAFAHSALAETYYYWVGDPWGSYGDVNNWRTGSVEGETWCVKARKIKGDDERLEYGLVRNRGFIISIY